MRTFKLCTEMTLLGIEPSMLLLLSHSATHTAMLSLGKFAYIELNRIYNIA